MLSLFQRQPRASEVPPAEPARPEAAYNPALVAGLTQQHSELVMRLVKADSLARQRLYEDVTRILGEFHAALQEHLRRESAELHPYLMRYLTGEKSRELLKQMQHEAVLAERSVESLVGHYTAYPVSQRTVLRFTAELEHVIEEFSARLEYEEAAYYTLYQPPGIY